MFNTILFCTQLLIKDMEHGTASALFFSFFVAALITFFYVYVYNTFPLDSINTINQKLFGKKIGKAFVLILIFVFFFHACVMSLGIVEIIGSMTSPDTPRLFIAFLMLLLPIVGFRNTDESLLKVLGFFVVIMVTWLFIEFYLLTKEANWGYMKGSFMHSLHMPAISQILIGVCYYGGLLNLVIFNPKFEKISYGKTMIVFLFIGFPISIAKIFLPAGIWGPRAVKNLEFVWVSTADTTSVDMFFIERGLFIIMPLFFIVASSAIIMNTFVGYGMIKNMKLKNKTNLIILSVIAILYLVIVYAVPSTDTLVNIAKLWYVVWSAIYVGNGILLFIFTFIYKRRRGKDAA